MNIPMTVEEKRAILKDLLHTPQRSDYPEPNITVEELMRDEGMTRAAAYGKLEALVEEGKLEKAAKRIKIGGHKSNLYWLANQEKRDTPQARDE